MSKAKAFFREKMYFMKIAKRFARALKMNADLLIEEKRV